MIADDMDSPGLALIGSHGYCSQEMVNLLLFGSAVSNTFDGDVTLGSAPADVTVLKGVSKRSDIGLLSLFEHYKSVTVGERLKSPSFPVWVVCSESHFTVIWDGSTFQDQVSSGTSRGRRRRLFYYDQLGRQEQVIQLTVIEDNGGCDVTARQATVLESPLNHCIRTKWPHSEIVWENCEPLL